VTGVTLTNGGSGYTSAPSVAMPSTAGTPASSATFQAIVVADGGTSFFPNPNTTGAWSRIINT
jgi:hypothetical protein